METAGIFLDHAHIHGEAFAAHQTGRYFGWDLAQATFVSTRIHTETAAFGKIMSTVKPRLAVGFHSVQSPENNVAIMDGVRKTYDGPLALARDLKVTNVTQKNINVAVVDEHVLPPDVTQAYVDAPHSDRKKTLVGRRHSAADAPTIGL